MVQNKQLTPVFRILRRIMLPYKRVLDCKEDGPGNIYLDTFHILENKKPLFFGAVQTRKSYVSFHLMPVYVDPRILKIISDSLRKRMHGKYCFNFKTIASTSKPLIGSFLRNLKILRKWVITFIKNRNMLKRINFSGIGFVRRPLPGFPIWSVRKKVFQTTLTWELYF